MLKLIKYEFIKNRIGLTLMALIFAGLEVCFLYGYFTKDEELMAFGMGMLLLYVVVAFFYVMYIGVNNYDKDLSKKSGYLVYMTPNSPIKIIASKFLYVLLVGVAVCVIMGGVGIFDMYLVLRHSDEIKNLIDMLDMLAEVFNYNWHGLVYELALNIVNFVIGFFSVVSVTYFAITLAATVLNNSRLRGVVTGVLTILLLIGVSWLGNRITPEYVAITFDITGSIKYLLPTIIYNAVVVFIGMVGSAFLTEKALSL